MDYCCPVSGAVYPLLLYSAPYSIGSNVYYIERVVIAFVLGVCVCVLGGNAKKHCKDQVIDVRTIKVIQK